MKWDLSVRRSFSLVFVNKGFFKVRIGPDQIRMLWSWKTGYYKNIPSSIASAL